MPNNLDSIARTAGLGRIAYRLWYQPRAAVHDFLKDGGPLAQRRTERGRQEMEAAAESLPALSGVSGAPIPVHLLTGRRFWYQSAFCLWSLSAQAGRPVAPVVYDDGTLEERYRGLILRLFPLARFVGSEEADEGMDRFLPADRFPSLRERRINYKHIRKITDPHAGSAGWKLVIDSDLLFFRNPGFISRWVDAPDRPLHAVDCTTAYGYPTDLMAAAVGSPVPDLVNVGLAGLRSDSIDWERLERWCSHLLEKQGPHYFLEQALVAMLLAGTKCAVAPAADYVTLPRPPESRDCRAVMHHYVAGSKRWYFQRNWRTAIDQGARSMAGKPE